MSHTRSVPRAWCFAALLFLAGCTSTATISAHTADPAYTGAPTRMVIVDPLDRAYTLHAPEKFAAAMTDVLEACGIRSKVYIPARIDLNGDRLRHLVSSFKPDVVLNMHQLSATREGFDTVSGAYTATLIDLRSHREVWKADVLLAGGAALIKTREKGAIELGRKIVQQMRQDGILRCRSP